MKEMIRIDQNKVFAVLITLLTIWLSFSTAFAIESKNYLLSENSKVELAATSDKFFNIFLLGVDFGKPGYYGSGGKKHFTDCHTDSIMVISINIDKITVDLVSIPRDTLTYVPNIRGIYKLNAAINCAKTIEEGIQNAVNAASWLLGGIPIDRYFVVDMNAVIALGDAIGGVDFNMDMAYTASYDRKYHKGMQHLDGLGIMDYLRARGNATIGANDLGRTDRNRKMISAVLKKLRSDFSLIPKALAAVNTEKHHVYTNIDQEDMLLLMLVALRFDSPSIGSHVLTGKYINALRGWNFTFTDQQHRLDVLKEVYGIDAEPIPYVSKKYTKWLEDIGFTYARHIFMAEKLLHFAQSSNSTTSEQQDLLAQFIGSYNEMIKAFEQAADTTSSADNKTMRDIGKQLKELGDKVAAAFHYPEKYSWRGNSYWYRDPLINEYYDIKWY